MLMINTAMVDSVSHHKRKNTQSETLKQWKKKTRFNDSKPWTLKKKTPCKYF